jgi:hypothetical protein
MCGVGKWAVNRHGNRILEERHIVDQLQFFPPQLSRNWKNASLMTNCRLPTDGQRELEIRGSMDQPTARRLALGSPMFPRLAVSQLWGLSSFFGSPLHYPIDVV